MSSSTTSIFHVVRDLHHRNRRVVVVVVVARPLTVQWIIGFVGSKQKMPIKTIGRTLVESHRITGSLVEIKLFSTNHTEHRHWLGRNHRARHLNRRKLSHRLGRVFKPIWRRPKNFPTDSSSFSIPLGICGTALLMAEYSGRSGSSSAK